MSVTMVALLIAAGLGFTVTALACLVRIVRGRTILDRMIASAVLPTPPMLAAGTATAVRGHTSSIPLMTVIAATATFATIVVARFVKRRSDQPAPPSTRTEVGHV